MEDEKGDVGRENSGGASDTALSGNIQNETLGENMGSEDRVEESYEEGDGGEIMVEVVGSDVFVDGVSSHKEGNFESREVVELEGPVRENKEEPGAQNFSEDIEGSAKGDVNNTRESELGLSESKDGRNGVAKEEANVSVSESADVEGAAVSASSARGVGGSDDEVLKSGIKATVVSSSVATESVTVQTEEVTKAIHLVVSDEKTIEDESVDKDSADFVKPETSNHPLEAIVDEKGGMAEKEEVLPSNNNAISYDNLSTDSAVSHGAANEAHDGQIAPSNEAYKDPENVKVDGVEPESTTGDSVTEAKCVDEKEDSAQESKDQILASDDVVSDVQHENQGNRTELDASFDNAEPAKNAGDSVREAKFVTEKEVSAAQSEDQIPVSDAVVSNVQDANQGNFNELHDAKFEANHQIDGVPKLILESVNENSLVIERGETIGMDSHIVLDFKEGANVDQQANDECLKTDGDVESDVVHQNRVCSNAPNQMTDEGHTSELSEDKNDDIQAETVENLQNMTSPGCQRDEEMLEANSGVHVNQPVVATTFVGEVMDDQKVASSQVEAVDKIGSEIPEQSLEHQGNAEIPALGVSTENMDLTETSACLKAETANVGVTVGNNPVVGSENVVEESGLPQNTEQNEVASIIAVSDGTPVVSLQTVETSNHETDKLESIKMMPNEVTSATAVSDSTQVSTPSEITEKQELHISTSGDVNKSKEADDNSSKADGIFIEEGHISETKCVDVEEESGSDITPHDKNEVDSELGTEEHASETDKPMLSNEETVKSLSSLRMNQPGYLLPPENEGCFAVSDLVWGKVRSHPWWPGQIFDPADASEKALKYYKKDSYLVAYFGDRTFAWNDASLLKPFRPHFSQIEKQSNSESFRNAVDCALEEVSRRVELGLACSCIPKDAHWKIETQVVDNAGIREESSRRFGVDQSSKSASFEPDKLLEYIIDLAPRASSGADRLDLVIAQAQLSAFCRFKGCRLPAEFPSSGDLLENDADTEQISDEMIPSLKRKHIPKDASESRKERSMTELMGDWEYSPDVESGRKRRALDPLADMSDRRESVSMAKVSTPMSQTPKPSFKIGECIRRVASQLTGSKDEAVTDSSPKIYEHPESFSVNEMLSQLQVVAQDPKKGHNFQKNIHTFFLGFRSSIALNKRGRKKKSEQTVAGSGEEFEFDDVNDSYWTDRIVQNYSEEQLLHNGENGAGSPRAMPFGAEKSVKPGRRPNSRKRYSTGSYPTEAIEEDESVKRRKQESSPAELILNFAERKFVPSEINLNKMFRRFGPLMESETEVDHESGRAKVIFKRGADAEVARNSSEKFNIFGPALVNYQIGYSPLISVKIMPVAVPPCPEDASLML